MKKIVLLFLFALTSALVVAQTRYEVIVSIVNVRDTANGKIVGTIQKGQRVEVYSVENGWAKIIIGKLKSPLLQNKRCTISN